MHPPNHPSHPVAPQQPGPPQPGVPPYPRTAAPAHPVTGPVPQPGPHLQRRPRRSLVAALVCLGTWSLLAPLTVLLLGMVAYAGMVVATFALVVLTFGAIAADPQGEAWINDTLGAGDHDTWMGHVTPVAWASLVVTLAFGGLVLALLRQTRAVTWHPVLQGTLSAAAAVVLLVVWAGLIGLVV